MSHHASLRFGDPARPGFHACSGCALCLLPCPVWQERRDPMLTLAGRMKALQGGADIGSLALSAESCVLCGACEPVCPENIDTVGFNLGLRQALAGAGLGSLATRVEAISPVALDPAPRPSSRVDTLLLAGRGLGRDLGLVERVLALLGGGGAVALAALDGHDLAARLEAGAPVDLAPLVEGCRSARELVVAEGLLHRPLRRELPGIAVVGLGEALLRRPALRRALGPDDLYVIESRGYHADFERLVRFYDALRKETGCLTNLDLQRTAATTSASSLQAALGSPALDAAGLARWILEGRRVERVVVEAVEDRAAFVAAGAPSVVHLAELAA